MGDNDQDIDTAGTEADEDFTKRHGDRLPEGHDATSTPLGAVPEPAAPADEEKTENSAAQPK